MLGREGVCIEHESDIFLIDMAAEGHGVTVLTRVQQLHGSSYCETAWIQATLTSFLLTNGRRKFFSPPLVFSLPRFDASSVSCLRRSDSSCVRCSFLLRSLSAHARHRSFFLTLFAHRNVGLSCAVMGARSVW